MRVPAKSDNLNLVMPGSDESASEITRWVQDARSGDREAVERLCVHFRPQVQSYVTRHMGPRIRRWTDPDDVVQKVLFEVLGRLDTLPPEIDEAHLLKRLYRTASSRIKDDVRRNDARVGESAVASRPRLAGNHSTRSGTVTRNDDRRWLEELITHLPPKYKDVVELCALQQLSFSEAALQLGLEIATVRKRYERARNALVKRTRQDQPDE